MESFTEKELLGRQRFANQLASAIKASGGEESLVIGIFGPWGAGKTRLKNMVLGSLRSADVTPSPLILEFNPWEWSGHKEVTAALFEQIRETLHGEDKSKAERRLARRLELYEARLNTISIGLEGMKKSVDSGVKSAVGLLLLAIASSFQSSIIKWAGYLAGGITLVIPFLKSVREFLKSAAQFFSEEAKWRELPLEALKAKLSKALIELQRPLLIAVDDVDRLSAEEIRTLFQLIKQNLNFPNIIYLLCMQKDYVAHALEEGLKVDSGASYLQKIVHVGFDLPVVERKRLEGILRGELEKVVTANSHGIEMTRLDELFSASFAELFATLRDVERFICTLAFHLKLLRQGTHLELDFVDLAIVESLRHFEASAYRGIMLHKRALLRTMEPLPYFRKENQPTPYQQAVTRISDAASEHKEAVATLLGLLFPPPMQVTAENTRTWLREFRICTLEGFDRYFLLNVPQGGLSRNEFLETLEAALDTEGFCRILRQNFERGRLVELLEYLEASAQEVASAHRASVITALFNCEDCFETRVDGLIEVSTLGNMSLVVVGILKSEQDEQRRAELLLTAIQQTTGVLLPVSLLDEEINRRSQHPHLCILPESSYPRLREACAAKLQTRARDGSLVKNREFSVLLQLWHKLAPEQSSDWVRGLISDPRGVLDFLHGFMDHIDPTRGFGEGAFLVAILVIEGIVPVTLVSERIREFGLDSFNDEALKRFQLGLLLKAQRDNKGS